MSGFVDVVALRKKFQNAGQEHVLQFWDDLAPEQQGQLVEQLNALDVDRVNDVYKRALQGEEDMKRLASSKHTIEAPSESSLVSVASGSNEESVYRAAGLDAIAAGQVGVLLMAGGQGTRLGSSDPKGCYDIGLPSHKSLFQLQAERILRLQELAAQHAKREAGSVIITWFIMTSGPTRKPTESFFQKHSFFGLKQDNVVFFEQGTLPCLTMEGKIMLDAPHRIATAPDGNGGIYRALRQPLSQSTFAGKTVMSILTERKIEYLHAYGVDNCLVRVGDPVFIGINVQRCKQHSGHQAGVKTVRKVDPKESVGVVARRDGKWSVIEYSEIPAELSDATDQSGELLFRSANIVNHFYTTSFLSNDVEAIEEKIPFHIARKKIPTIDLQTGQAVKPSTPNGMKMELFIFDVFPYLNSDLTIHEVERPEEFSPLKNARGTGSDDPDTSKRDLLALQRKWLEKAGAIVEQGVHIEISPLVSYAGEGLESCKGRTFTESGTLDHL